MTTEQVELKVILAGIGGQGVVFATRLLAQAAVEMGAPVLASETHGMSQRGGSVLAHLKISGTEAPLIRRGTADILLAFERDEALRSLEFLRSGGVAFVNDSEEVPLEVQEALDLRQVEIHSLPAKSMAIALGSSAVTNVVLIGFAAAHPIFAFPLETIRTVLGRLAPKARDLNLRALEAGYGSALQDLASLAPLSASGTSSAEGQPHTARTAK